MSFWNNTAQSPFQTQNAMNMSTLAYFPQLAAAFNHASNKNILPAALANLKAQQTVADPTNALMTQLFAKYGPQLAKIGLDIGGQTQQGQADINAKVAGSSGGQAALQAAIDADMKANPEFYKTRTATGNAANTLLDNTTKALDNPLSSTVSRAIGQSIAQQGTQTGTVNTPSANQTTLNAMQYGEAGYNQQEQAKADLSDALTKATTFLPASQSGVGGANAFNIATGGSNTATGTAGAAGGFFQGIPSTSGGSNASQLGGILGAQIGSGASIAGAQMGANSGQPTGFGNVIAGGNLANDTASTVGKMAGCCFIVLESYHGMMPSYIRKSRDKFYRINKNMVTGYCKLASWLVPAMKCSFLVRSLVWHGMVSPATTHLGFVHGVNKPSWISKKLTRFWLKTFAIVGQHYSK